MHFEVQLKVCSASVVIENAVQCYYVVVVNAVAIYRLQYVTMFYSNYKISITSKGESKKGVTKDVWVGQSVGNIKLKI